MNENILKGGVEQLDLLKEKLIELDRYQNENSSLGGEEKRLVKLIASKEKEIEEEIDRTVRKRREEIEATYDQEIVKEQKLIKKVEGSKNKDKSAQISDRIEMETAQLKETYDQMIGEVKGKFRQEKIPRLFNTKVFYALYLPTGIRDYLIIMIAILFSLLVVPCGIYFFILQDQKVIYLILIYFLTVLIFGGIYIFIETKVKEKHLTTLKDVQSIRTNMLKNKIKRNKIKKKILKDKNDSSYALEHYDKEIKRINLDIEDILVKKKEALSYFDKNTRLVITKEIQDGFKEELMDLNKELEVINERNKETSEKIKDLTLELVNDYEAYIGREFMSLEKINSLIELIKEEKLTSVSEAITAYNQRNN